jgi:O-antigen/teichoic acid export membrane protein
MTIGAQVEDALPQPELEDRHRKLERKAVKGTIYVVVFYGLSLALRILSSVVLTRLFTPQYFGIITLVTTVLVGLSLFSHIGVHDSVIQSRRGDEPLFLQTAQTIELLRGTGVWILCIALAWPVARFYHEPRIAMLLPVVGFSCVISGATSPSVLSLTRHMGVGKTSLLELLGQIVAFVVTLVWALIHPSLWALVGGKLASDLVRTIASYFILPELRLRFSLDRECVRELLHFGKWILIGTALTFLAQQSDRLILGKLASTTMLGIYGIAFSLSDLPRQIIMQFSSRVGYPFIAKFASKPRKEYRAILLKYRLPVLAVGALGLIIAISVGDEVILHVYDHRYHDAAWMIGILAIGLWHTTLYSTLAPSILALSKSHYNAIGNLIYCIALFTLIPLGYHYYAMPGAVAAVAFGDLPVYLVVQYSACREKVGTLLQDGLMTVAFLVALAGALALRMALGFGLPFHGMH